MASKVFRFIILISLISSGCSTLNYVLGRVSEKDIKTGFTYEEMVTKFGKPSQESNDRFSKIAKYGDKYIILRDDKIAYWTKITTPTIPIKIESRTKQNTKLKKAMLWWEKTADKSLVRTVAPHLSNRIVQKGYILTDQNSADVVIISTFGEEKKEARLTKIIPIYHYIPNVYQSSSGQIYNFGSVRYTGDRVLIEDLKYYVKTFNIKAIEWKPQGTKEDQLELLWETTSIVVQSSPGIKHVLPAMLVAASSFFDFNSGGPQTVTLFEDDPAIKEVAETHPSEN